MTVAPFGVGTHEDVPAVDAPRHAALAGQRQVAVVGIDRVAPKNLVQFEAMAARGVAYDVFATGANPYEAVCVPAPGSHTVLPAGATARLRVLWRYFRAHAQTLHHVEVYPGGRFAAAYVELARAFGVPVLVVERGDLVNFGRAGRLLRASMVRAYRRATCVWYREPYQERALQAIGVDRMAFLGNAVRAPERAPRARARDIEFLWVNRLVAERKAGWLVDALADPALAGARAVVAGLLDPPTDAGVAANQAYVRAHAPAGLELLPYGAPEELYRRAQFFVLPSDIVYCNNALLEAMARGVVPLVSDVEGARLIVEDGVDGFVFPHSPAGLRAALRRARALPPTLHAQMAARAQDTVRHRFSDAAWAERLTAIYAQLRAPG